VDEKSKLRGDLDNMVKTALDALNGKAWADDRQVVKISAVKL
jgi:Holliday junction resolvase RusA-like endonuclease